MQCYRFPLIAAAVLSASFSQVAVAADMPVKTPVYKAEPAVVAYQWSGFYVGAHGGWGWDTKVINFSGSPNTAVFFANNVFPTSLDPDASGFIGGGQIGYNWQHSLHWLLGIEADFSGSDINGSAFIRSTPTNLFVPFDTTLSKKISWFGTVRGRIGWIGGRWLVYATGGLAYGRTEVAFNTVASPPLFGCFAATTCTFGSAAGTKFGWTAGGGVEVMPSSNWTFRVEYLYLDLGSRSVTAQSYTAAGFFFTAGTEFREHIVRGAINYKFGG